MIKNASELYDWQMAIKAATGRDDVACVIGAWMAGVPSSSTVDRVAADYRAVIASEVNVANLVRNLFYSPGTALGSLVGNLTYGDEIYTIEQACPGGLTVAQALRVLKDADADLWERVTQSGELQRARVAEQANATARENLGRDVIDATKYVLSGLDRATGLWTAVRWGVAAGVLYGVSRLWR